MKIAQAAAELSASEERFRRQRLRSVMSRTLTVRTTLPPRLRRDNVSSTGNTAPFLSSQDLPAVSAVGV